MHTRSFEPRRRKDLFDELKARAGEWLADWHPQDEQEFATALFKIAARIESEVTQRLDRAPERAFRSFLDWLGVKGKPGRAARLPVVFTMTPGSDPVDAPDRVQLQINVGDTPVSFETEQPLRVLPGTLAAIVAADPKNDAFYQPTASVFNLKEPALVPSQWQLKSDAPAQATTLQLDPPLGLEPGRRLSDPSGQQYLITSAQGGIVTVKPTVGTIEPKPGITPAAPAGLTAGTVMTRVDVFAPFGPTERNQQEHALYIGSATLNVEAPAKITIQNGARIPSDARWWYSGKPSVSAPIDWVQVTHSVDGGDVVLDKPKGAIETLKVDGYESRWLKATRAPGITEPSDAQKLRLFINCLDDWEKIDPVTAIEGIASITPLVLDSGFYPLGREPRQFDSFYLGSKEAFSKPSAAVQLSFSLGTTVSNGWAAVRLTDTSYFAVGVSDDGRLQRVWHRVVAGMPTVAFLSPTQPSGTGQRAVGLSPDFRPGVVTAGTVRYVSVASGSNVWLWMQQGPDEEWKSLQPPVAGAQGAAAAVHATMLTRDAAGAVAYAIAGGKLHKRSVADGSKWNEVPIKAMPQGQVARMVVPVVPGTGRAGDQIESDGVVVVTDKGRLLVDDAPDWKIVTPPTPLDPSFYPVVVKISGTRLCISRDENKHPVAFDLAKPNQAVTLAGVKMKGHSLDIIPLGDHDISALLVLDHDPALAMWDPFRDGATRNVPPLFHDASDQPEPGDGPFVVGIISAARRFVFVPGADGKAYVTAVGLAQHLQKAAITDVAVFADPRNWAGQSGLLLDLGGNLNKRVVIVDEILSLPPDTWLLKLHEAGKPWPTAKQVQVYKTLDVSRSGKWKQSTELELDPADTVAAKDKFVFIELDGKTRVIKIDQVAGGKATLAASMPNANVNDPVPYTVCREGTLATSLTVQFLPAVDIQALDTTVTSELPHRVLESQDPSLTPLSQTVRFVATQGQLAVLDSPWDGSAAPAHGAYDFVAKINPFDAWTGFEPPKPRNPTLSWEYFDGTAWRLIPGIEDYTDNLAKEDNIKFCVPKDLQPTDVVGRKNHWIRARLVGGDYGQESVKVVTTTDTSTTPPTTTQTIIRGKDDIRAPYVSRLEVRYKVCCPLTPEFVIARDNAGLRDQTDVNRSAGSTVEYFIPLSTALQRAAGNDASAHASDRALYLGFDTKLTGGPIQILFLVDEGSHDAAYPLRVDALIGNRFKPIVVKDNTRGLNESGTLEMTLAESPQQTELFGTTKYWLRVRPGVRLPSEDAWQPKVRAAYLNATWAIAAETQRFEQLGSSDGSPNQQFMLARPPVIEGSLKLRVLERLGDEDIEKLRGKGVDIKDTFPNFPERRGCWVLWKEVDDPADEDAGERVYALDDATGVITFGNGLNGMIPPIGANVILAEEYQRGGGEAANRVTAWSQINLVTALSGVNAVMAPEGAAGGSDPQDADTTLRFAPPNLRMRDRALTLADFEMLALQFSRDVAQARALPARDGMRLIVVMRGRNPKPNAQVIRELKAYLLAHASPSVGGREVVQITGPVEVVVRVELTLVVDAIESSGEVSRQARERVEKLLDAAAGGHDRIGWALGAIPTDTEIAAELADIPHVESITSVTVTRIDGKSLTSLRPIELARLAPDGVTVDVRLESEVAV
jgi:hypothetical protein